MDDPANRDSAGRFGPGNTANPSGRPKAFKAYQEWLEANALEPAKTALLSCLHDEDGRVRMAAIKEVADRLFGKAPQTILGEDGKPLLAGFGAEVIALLNGLKKSG